MLAIARTFIKGASTASPPLPSLLFFFVLFFIFHPTSIPVKGEHHLAILPSKTGFGRCRTESLFVPITPLAQEQSTKPTSNPLEYRLLHPLPFNHHQ
ncbi:hypothetical protein V2G26_005397 [Clonostachys chloroleuca]